MNSNYQNKSNKRSSVDYNYSSNASKRFKTERVLKVSESANNRLKLLRKSLANPHVNQTESESTGWKPPAVIAIHAIKVNKPQLVAKRQYSHAVRKISQTNLSPKASSSARKSQNKIHKSMSKNTLKESLNQSQQTSYGEELLLNSDTDERCAKKKYGQKQSTNSFVNDERQKNSDIKKNSGNVGSSSILKKSKANKTRFEPLSFPIVDDGLNNTETNLVENNNTFRNLSSSERRNIEEEYRDSASDTFCQSCPAKFHENSSLNGANNTSLIFKDCLNQMRNFAEVRVPNSNIYNTKSVSTSRCNKNTRNSTSPKLSEYRNEPRCLEYQEMRNNFYHNSSTPTVNSTSFSNPLYKEISVQGRLKSSVSSPNNVYTRPNSTSDINSQSNDISNTIQNSDDIESEPMEWSDIDVIEVIQNVEQMRKVRKYPPETETELQHMLNVNNTFAEKYQNPRENCNEIDYYIVVDTNVFLSKLSIIKEILSINLRDNKKLYVYIPWMVVQELDYFKDGKYSTNKLQANARKAITLLNECLGVIGSHLKAQLVTDALEAKSISKEPDDIILACCLQAKERNHIVILLSNDTNLRNKAIINNLSAYSTDDILEKLKFNTDKSGLQIDVDQIELRTSILLSVVIDECLREAYGNIFDQMAVKKPPYTLLNALELMRKYWISVFSSILQKQSLNTIDKLYDLMRQRSYTGLPDSGDKKKFVDLTLTLCVFLKTSFSHQSDNIDTLVGYIKSSTGR